MLTTYFHCPQVANKSVNARWSHCMKCLFKIQYCSDGTVILIYPVLRDFWMCAFSGTVKFLWQNIVLSTYDITPILSAWDWWYLGKNNLCMYFNIITCVNDTGEREKHKQLISYYRDKFNHSPAQIHFSLHFPEPIQPGRKHWPPLLTINQELILCRVS